MPYIKAPPVGNSIFKVIRKMDYYYVDKSLMIKDFIEMQDTVTLITRPRRFGKTLNMTMLRDFFDITADNRAYFAGLKIMDTEYAQYINSRPVIYISFKDCKANSATALFNAIKSLIYDEYEKHFRVMNKNLNACNKLFLQTYNQLFEDTINIERLKNSIHILEKALTEYYDIEPIALIDEYDQPIISSYEYGYYNELVTFFSGFYGAALKDQEFMRQALLTGIQRVAKESIFSQLNNLCVYTILDSEYSDYFGFSRSEANELLVYYGFILNAAVVQQYDGYVIGGTQIYNPWSLLKYVKTGKLANHWINTSTNYLIISAINDAGSMFREKFQELIREGTATVGADLGCSFIELKDDNTLWGLLINAGYVTVINHIGEYIMTVKIPNGEVASEFVKIVASQANVRDADLRIMFQCLQHKDIESFLSIYSEIVVCCTSYFDAKEYAYHMLFLGMCISLRGMYKIVSNIESGYGRSDIILEALSRARPHIIIEFKQGEDVDALKEEALRHIIDNKYFMGLRGEVLCVGIAHNKKKCAVAHEIVTQ